MPFLYSSFKRIFNVSLNEIVYTRVGEFNRSNRPTEDILCIKKYKRIFCRNTAC